MKAVKADIIEVLGGNFSEGPLQFDQREVESVVVNLLPHPFTFAQEDFDLA